MDNGGWGAGWIAMLIVMLVFLVLAAVVVWFLLSGSRRSIGGSSAEPSRPTPEQVLSEVGRLDRRLRAREPRLPMPEANRSASAFPLRSDRS